MVYRKNESHFMIPNFKVDYYHHQKESFCLDRPCSFQMSGYKSLTEKMSKKPISPSFKESEESFNSYSSLFSSKTYSILSYVVGGFVGSKSQMNNNKHNLSYDLSAAIFNLLNPCKYEKEKVFMRKNNENNFSSAASKIHPEYYEKYIVNKSSQKVEKMKDCVVDVMELECLVTIPLQELTENENYVLNFNKQCSDSKLLAGHLMGNIEDNFFEWQVCDEAKCLNKSSEVNKENKNCDTTDNVNSESIVKENVILESFCKSLIENKETEHFKSLEESCSSPEVLDGECSSSISLNESSSADTLLYENIEKLNDEITVTDGCLIPVSTKLQYPKRAVSFLENGRLRQLSECSVESTDSESFIIFDDYLSEDEDKKEGKIYMKLDLDRFGAEDGNEEYESSSDEYDLCSIDKEVTDANDRWLKNYKDVIIQDAEPQRKVRFNDDIKVNKILAWDYAYRAARPGPWEQIARDRVRFNERILRLSSVISPVLRKEHRDRIYKKLYS